LIETTVTSERVYSGRIVSVRVDRVRLADGAETAREVVDHPGSTAVVALDDAGRVLLVEQYRYPARQELWEIPAGRLEPDETAAEAASRELAEEAGLAAAHLEHLLTVWASPGYCSERLWVYLASGLSEKQGLPDPDERIAKAWFPLGEAVTMCLYGQIVDAKTVAAILAVAARRRSVADAVPEGPAIKG
jgi:ADP-ribose pyrophosphatase